MLDQKPTALPRKIFWVFAGFAFIILAITIPTAVRIGVDPYHEGALFPSAVGVAQGLSIFSEVNNQYGFMYALIQAPLLSLFGNYLLIARVVGVIVLLSTIVFSYTLVRKVWGRQTSFLVAITCLAINPSWSYISGQSLNAFGAWINQYGVFLVITSVFLILREHDKRNPTSFIYFLAGGISLCSTFVRLDFFSVWFLQSLFLFLSVRKGILSRRNFVLWLSGSMLTGAVSAIYLLALHSATDFLDQLIIVWFSSPPNSANLGLGNALTFVASCLSFAVYFFLIYFASRNRFAWAYIATITTLTVYLISTLLTKIDEILISGKVIGPYLYTALDGFLLNYSSALIVILLVVTLFRTRLDISSLRFKLLFLQVTSVGLLPQLHNVNSAYIFMFSPILVTWFLYWLRESKYEFPGILLGLRNTFISLVIVSLLFATSLAFKPIHNFNSPILRGMADYSIEKRNEIDAKFELLDKYVGAGELYFDCPYGLFSVSQNGLYTADQWTWNEIPKKWLQQSIAKSQSGDFLLRCNGGLENVFNYDESIKIGKIRILGNVADFELFQFQ